MIEASEVNLYYGKSQALFNISCKIQDKSVTSFIGPSGCGKSSFLRCINRMNDLIEICKIDGNITVQGEDISKADPVELRKRVGMAFQKPVPFPMSIYNNVAYGPKIHGLFTTKAELDEIVEASLTKAGLWNEVKDRLKSSGFSLSGGQQQRLCIARCIANKPEIILMDEPCSALDPIATDKVETLITNLKKEYTIVIVTHSMQQAKRISDKTAFFHLGKLIEYDDAQNIFENPQHELTKDYIYGRTG